jgi:large subunit ribosomal protein L6
VSRLGKKKIIVPESVKFTVKDNKEVIIAKDKDVISMSIPDAITVEFAKGTVEVKRNSDVPKVKALHGLIRNNIFNVIRGLEVPYKKILSIKGVGYKAVVAGKNLTLEVGFSHPVKMDIPQDVTVSIEPKTGRVIVSGKDKYMVGEFAAKVRRIKPPEPYKETGIKYADEYVKRKVVKSGSGSKK